MLNAPLKESSFLQCTYTIELLLLAATSVTTSTVALESWDSPGPRLCVLVLLLLVPCAGTAPYEYFSLLYVPDSYLYSYWVSPMAHFSLVLFFLRRGVNKIILVQYFSGSETRSY